MPTFNTVKKNDVIDGEPIHGDV